MVDYEKSLCGDCFHLGICKYIQKIDDAINTTLVKIAISECSQYKQQSNG